MMIGTLAIAGIFPLSGFFSKDEILFRTFTSNNPYRLLLWGIGMVTSLLTATYMFRLVFLTFWGESRSPAASAHQAPHAHGHDHGHHSGHAGHLHDAPPAMAILSPFSGRTRQRTVWSSGPSRRMPKS